MDIEPNGRDLLVTKDAILKQVIETVPLPPIISTNNVFHDLMSCVLEQQIHYRSSKKIFQKMCKAAGIDILSPEKFAQFEEKAFSAHKLSIRKYEAALEIVDFFKQHTIDWHKLEDKEVRSKLLAIKGVSNWTVDMLLLYTLKRLDIFPADDYHLKQIMPKLYPIDRNERLQSQMKKIAVQWVPYRSLGVKYLFAWKEFYRRK